MMKNWRMAGSLSLVLVLALLGACATADKPRPVVVPSVVQAPGQKAIYVTDEQSGAAIVLEPAQELVVILAIGAATGRDWTLVDLKPGVLTVTSARFERALRNTNSEESAGAMAWRFLPQAAGSVDLKFDLRRPRSLEPAARTVAFTVTAQ